MKVKSQRDFAAGLMFLVVGAGFAIGATQYAFGSSAKPGPGYFPLMLGVLLALLGALVTFKALSIESDGGDPIGAIAWKPLLMILGSVVLFGLLLPRLGLLITLPLLIVGAGLGGDEFRWRDALLSSAVLTLLAWVVFIKGLSLTLPLWPTFLG